MDGQTIPNLYYTVYIDSLPWYQYGYPVDRQTTPNLYYT